MIKVKQLFKMLFLLMTIISLSACTKEDSVKEEVEATASTSGAKLAVRQLP
jgi:uncharacterized lipoprotein YehR (DUF1307 family)